jgi:Xaa-Pro dipeptidase
MVASKTFDPQLQHSSHPPSLADLYRVHVEALRRGYALALEEHGFSGVVIHSGSLRLRSIYDDAFSPLRVVPHFAHWLPLEWPDCALVVGRTGRPRLCAYRDRSFWERWPEPEWAHFEAEIDVHFIAQPEAARGELDAWRRTGRVALIAEDPKRTASWGFDDADVNPEKLLLALDALRTRKSAYEVECLAEANRRAARGHHAVADAFRRGTPASELDLHLLYLSATAQDDAETPYKGIVAVGANAAILHHIHYERNARAGDRSLLLDAGATCHGYASDVTRSYVEGRGEGAAAFRALLSHMEQLQRHSCARIELGMPYEALHDAAHRDLAAVLRDVGIARASEAELIDSGVTRLFFPHGLGHSLGLQTHDVGCLVAPPRADNPWLRNTTPVTSGQVFTIEPGIYFIDDLLEKLAASPQAASIDWALVDALRPFGGIRIEDDVFIGEGHDAPLTRNLTREALGD